MPISELELEALLKANPNLKIKEITPAVKTPVEKTLIEPTAPAEAKDFSIFAKMNKLEKSYAYFLDTLAFEKKIKLWRYEPFNLRLANPKCFYRIDFLVINNLNQIELHETKGGWTADDALVKFKVAAETYPFFIFKWITKDKGEFIIKTLENGVWFTN